VNEMQKLANDFRKEGEFLKACVLYSKLWSDQENAGDWDGWGYAFCLLKLKRYKDALSISRQVMRRFPDFREIRGVYSWAIYHTEVKEPRNNDEDRMFNAAMAITQIVKQEDTFSPYIHTILAILHYLSKKRPFPAESVLTWTEKLRPDTLSNVPFIFTTTTGKTREYSSQIEKYYIYRTRGLYSLNQYDRCLVACQKALSEIDKFHENNYLWIARFEAMCYLAKGDLDSALKKYTKITTVKKDWLVLKDIAQIYSQQDQWATALKFAISSAMAPGDREKKIALFDLLSFLHNRLGKRELSEKHMLLAYLLRFRLQKPIHFEIQKRVASMGNLPSERILFLELRNYWESIEYGNIPRIKGKIINILANGKGGFLQDEEGNPFYFLLADVFGKSTEVRIGREVTFFLQEGYDLKRKETNLVAVSIRLL
jgi:tetratricopeptide (TPR) repeat protein